MEINKQQVLQRFNKPKDNIRDERADLISQIVEAVNAEREKDGWKYFDKKTKKWKKLGKVTARGIGVKVGEAKMSKTDLYWFIKKCQNAESFGKMFFGCLKVK